MVGEAAVHSDATVVDECKLLGPAIIRGGTIEGGAWNRTPVFVQGTRYWVCESNDGHIASGCIRKPVDWWLENVERCAEEHNYTEEQQAEYREIIELVAARMKALGNVSDKEEAAA